MRHTKRQQPLARISGTVKARAYRGKLKLAPHARYLDAKALTRTKKVVIEIGTLEAGGYEVPVAAEIHRGQVVKLKPVACEHCGPATRRRKLDPVARKRTAVAALKKLQGLGAPTIRLPVSVARLTTIDVGPIVVIIYNGGWDICIDITWPDGESCLYCLFGPGICVGPVVILTRRRSAAPRGVGAQ